MSVSSSSAVSYVQHLATFLTVYPPPPRTRVGMLNPFTNFTQSLHVRVKMNDSVSLECTTIQVSMALVIANNGN